MGDIILTMKDIDKSFPGVHALDHVNFEVRKGEVHALMGENGAGKSTLMKVLTGIYTKDSGSIVYEGKGCAGPGYCYRTPGVEYAWASDGSAEYFHRQGV